MLGVGLVRGNASVMTAGACSCNSLESAGRMCEASWAAAARWWQQQEVVGWEAAAAAAARDAAAGRGYLGVERNGKNHPPKKKRITLYYRESVLNVWNAGLSLKLKKSDIFWRYII
jgi:hypothetical protein